MKEDKPGWKKDDTVERVYVKYDPKKKIPNHEDILPNQREKGVKELSSAVCVTNESNQNLTTSQEELLLWYFRLRHIGFQHVQWLIRTGCLKVQVNSKAVANCERPKCSAYKFVKGHLRSNKVNTINKNTIKEQDLKKEHIMPGNMVSAYHYILRDPGSIYHKKWKPYPSDIFSGVCVFIDHASGYVSIKHQVDINATETVKEKPTFNSEAKSQGVEIKGYHTDNGIFNASYFIEELFKKQQKIRFSGSGASHQNGAAEHAINKVFTKARNMLMHAAIICPEETLSTDILTMTMDYSVWVYNRIPDMQSGLSAIEIWSRSIF